MDGWSEGILVVDKAVGPTSHDVVAMARRALQLRRIGHCGTLDPLASGVLVLCIGPLTRLSDWISRGEKEYEATIRLGATSSTDDSQGEIKSGLSPIPSRDQIEAALVPLRGDIEQVPPAHSAVKVDGVRSYHRARRNEEIELAPRSVRVKLFEIVDFSPPHLRVRVECGKGTYIRSLARDLGIALGCGGYVEVLRRLRIGTMGVQDAVDLETLRAGEEQDKIRAACVDPRSALQGILRPLDLDDERALAFAHGQIVEMTDLPMGEESQEDERAVFGGTRFLGIGQTGGGQVKPARVFTAPAQVA